LVIGPQQLVIKCDNVALVPVAGVNSYVVRVTGPGLKWHEVNNATHIVLVSHLETSRRLFISAEADNGEVKPGQLSAYFRSKKSDFVKAAAKQITGQTECR